MEVPSGSSNVGGGAAGLLQHCYPCLNVRRTSQQQHTATTAERWSVLSRCVSARVCEHWTNQPVMKLNIGPTGTHMSTGRYVTSSVTSLVTCPDWPAPLDLILPTSSTLYTWVHRPPTESQLCSKQYVHIVWTLQANYHGNWC